MTLQAIKEWWITISLDLLLGLSPNLKWSRTPRKRSQPSLSLSLSLSLCFLLLHLSIWFTSSCNKHYLYHTFLRQTHAMHLLPPEFGRIDICQNSALHKAFSPSPHRRWTSLILSADLQIPLQLQSNDATQTLPAWAFHSQSVVTIGNKNL